MDNSTSPDWQAFDPENPPVAGAYWMKVRSQVWDIDADDYGQTIGTQTGETKIRLRLGWLARGEYGEPVVEVPCTGHTDAEFQSPDFDCGEEIIAVMLLCPPGVASEGWKAWDDADSVDAPCWVRLKAGGEPVLCEIDPPANSGEEIQGYPLFASAAPSFSHDKMSALHPLNLPALQD